MIIPWHTSVSSCELWLHTWPCQSCTCVQFQEQVDHRGWGPSTMSKLTKGPIIEGLVSPGRSKQQTIETKLTDSIPLYVKLQQNL